ncbi:MAG: FadR/GntR family transcriptional regulator [Roseateles asaccharophilus]|uniref:FadR/GntR family transcriptional regulator n=1 Tax=Roseateles asaccharophilus TaxID=582607 RepID=UPI00391BF048
MSLLQGIESRRLYRQIADQLALLIRRGNFSIGERLPAERELAEQLGVSRPSVREALIALEVEGIVEVRGGSGVYVTARERSVAAARNDAPAPGPFDLIHARWLIESECALLAASHASPQQLQRLNAALEDMRAWPSHSPQSIAADQRFHLTIAEASGNAALLLVVEQLWALRTGALYSQLESHFVGEQIWQQAIQEHTQLLTAITQRDPAAAQHAMRMHMKNAEVRFASNWKPKE